MSGLFGGSTPKPTPLPPPPNRSAQDIQDQAAAQRAQFYGAQGGRALTMLTGGSGVGQTPSAVLKLLGGSS